MIYNVFDGALNLPQLRRGSLVVAFAMSAITVGE